MNCCERSERVRSLVAELRVIVEWDSLDQRSGKVLERYEMDGRVAREKRRAEIIAELNTLRHACQAQQDTGTSFSECGVKELFGDGVCGQPASASVPPKQHSRTL